MEKSAGYYSSLDSLYDSTDNGNVAMSDKDKYIYNLLQRTTIEKVSRVYFICVAGIHQKMFIFAANLFQSGATPSRENSSTQENRSLS